MSVHTAMGMSRADGSLLTPLSHLQQSINDILTTPLGSRLMRRDYGSLLPFLIDQPANKATRLRLMSAIATAVIKWEPRVKMRKVSFSINEDGTNSTGNKGIDIHIDMRLADNRLLNTSLSIVRGAS